MQLQRAGRQTCAAHPARVCVCLLLAATRNESTACLACGCAVECMQQILLLCIFSRQRSQPSAARTTAPFKTSPFVSSPQCMGLSQVQKEGLAITGKPVVLPSYCREVDTEFKCTRCNNVRARRCPLQQAASRGWLR